MTEPERPSPSAGPSDASELPAEAARIASGYASPGPAPAGLQPDDAQALKATVRTFPDSSYDLEEVLTSLGTGEAVVTVRSESGAPTPAAATRLRRVCR